jgi:hypothetical protein
MMEVGGEFGVELGGEGEHGGGGVGGGDGVAVGVEEGGVTAGAAAELEDAAARREMAEEESVEGGEVGGFVTGRIGGGLRIVTVECHGIHEGEGSRRKTAAPQLFVIGYGLLGGAPEGSGERGSHAKTRRYEGGEEGIFEQKHAKIAKKTNQCCGVLIPLRRDENAATPSWKTKIEGPHVRTRAGLCRLRQVAADVPGGRLSGQIVRQGRRTPPVLRAVLDGTIYANFKF